MSIKSDGHGIRETDTKRAHKLAKPEIDALVAEVESLREQLQQTSVQLAGCSVAALGYHQDTKQGDFGWSASMGDVQRLHQRLEQADAEVERLRAACGQYREALLAWKHFDVDGHVLWARTHEAVIKADKALNDPVGDEFLERLTKAEARVDDLLKANASHKERRKAAEARLEAAERVIKAVQAMKAACHGPHYWEAPCEYGEAVDDSLAAWKEMRK